MMQDGGAGRETHLVLKVNNIVRSKGLFVRSGELVHGVGFDGGGLSVRSLNALQHIGQGDFWDFAVYFCGVPERQAPLVGGIFQAGFDIGVVVGLIDEPLHNFIEALLEGREDWVSAGGGLWGW
jgi:hypothetical protein